MLSFVTHAFLGVLVWGLLAVVSYEAFNLGATTAPDCSARSVHHGHQAKEHKTCQEPRP